MLMIFFVMSIGSMSILRNAHVALSNLRVKAISVSWTAIFPLKSWTDHAPTVTGFLRGRRVRNRKELPGDPQKGHVAQSTNQSRRDSPALGDVRRLVRRQSLGRWERMHPQERGGGGLGYKMATHYLTAAQSRSSKHRF